MEAINIRLSGTLPNGLLIAGNDFVGYQSGTTAARLGISRLPILDVPFAGPGESYGTGYNNRE